MWISDYDREHWWEVWEEGEDNYFKYLQKPQEEVNEELDIFLEPSTQGGMGSMYVLDNTDDERFEPVSVDFMEWCELEYEMATLSETEEEYKEKYKRYILDLTGLEEK